MSRYDIWKNDEQLLQGIWYPFFQALDLIIYIYEPVQEFPEAFMLSKIRNDV